MDIRTENGGLARGALVTAVGLLVLLTSLHDASSQPLLSAQASVWETYKRIRRGEAEAGDAAPAPASPQPNPQPNPQPSAPAPTPAQPPGTEAYGEDRRLPEAATEAQVSGAWWAWYGGKMPLPGRNDLGPYGRDFRWSYARVEPMPGTFRVLVNLHDAGEGRAAMEAFAPDADADLELRVQDAGVYDERWREWWIAGPGGEFYPARRIAAALEVVGSRYGTPDRLGVVLRGQGMGATGALVQPAILPDPWRARVAWISIRGGHLPAAGERAADPARYPGWPDEATNDAFWQSIDLPARMATDPLLRDMHWRGVFGSGSVGARKLLYLVNALERHRVSGAFAWVAGDNHGYERGVRLPDLALFESPQQNVSLDRPHPAITNSTGNFPLTGEDRVKTARYPRGHYNLGIRWDHAKTVDEPDMLAFPLAYTAHVDLGGKLPDQPRQIEISVTPRRSRNFMPQNGETLNWDWDNGTRRGTAVVRDGTVTVDGVPLVSGDSYRLLRITR